jgi:putative glutamine amidotransferase
MMGCDIRYPEALMRSGAAPILLPRTRDEEVVETAMDVVDALLLTGGGDVVSLAYGEEPHPSALHQDPVRDAMEFAAVHRAVERGIPVLGICRGIQALNVAFGGSLIQDIPSQVPDAVQHYTRAADTILGHSVDIEEDTLLAEILGATSTPVSSWHHQAVRQVGDGLRVNARARDGIVEGLEAADGRPILAVQCHPEESAEVYPLFQRLFDWLVEVAAQ